MCDEEGDSRKYSLSDNSSFQSVPDADREMAAQAFHEFEKQKYDECLSVLKKLLSKRPQDVKVLHNCAVVEYFLSGCKKTEKFKKKMAEVCRHVHIDLQDLETIDDVDNCIVLYNQSVVLYHLHQYHAAINILDKVYQFIEPLEETLARNICFLLIECYLAIYQPKKALCVIGFLESVLFADKNCNKSNQKEKEENDNCISDTLRRKLQLCKARSYAMMKTAKACKREIKNLLSSGSNIPNIPAYYLKCQLEYQRGNYKKALKLLNTVSLPDDISKYFKETGDCLPSIFYNNVGCIHFYMGKPNLGHFYTERALKEFENEIAKLTDSNDSKSPRPLYVMSISTKHQLMYNLGMQYLQAKKFHKAFSCFVEVVKSYHSNPRLWLRIAECCIHINKPNCMDEYAEVKKKPFIKSIVGAGPHQKIIMNSSALEKESSEDSKNSSMFESPSLQFAMFCLKNALYLVREHNYSTGDSDTNIQTASEENESSTSEENNTLSVLPSNYLQGAEIFSLRNSILISCSYVALSLGEVLLAHEYAKTLLSQPRISAAHKFLAHQYAGEALLIMDRITEAVEHLNFQCANEIELAFPVSSSEVSLKHQMRFDSKLNEKNDDGSRPVGNIPNWLPTTISSAKFVTQYNLAVAYACREEWNKAMECLNQMNPNGSVPVEALSLLIYVESHASVNDIKSTIQKYVHPGTA
ncbi:CCR4-NOT transcription complex subunit 10-like [Argiope bruennichi]|uniref:CCR4-NOT transcription complex subunit 10-like n=1 Tax=Argiope bruennichi TaxID=94029 RepID=UPI0024950B39|nr:CCR4-NOT transcription complex subunit 10-like [Argiope bruennichi]XP_055931474.1 CCR4-NOT transcription complex subunit 10-like [Argiope bruennichi]XP_055931482.1 CCR4-NOT transcription complex subunit 10-like [Argiope bruennichi]